MYQGFVPFYYQVIFHDLYSIVCLLIKLMGSWVAFTLSLLQMVAPWTEQLSVSTHALISHGISGSWGCSILIDLLSLIFSGPSATDRETMYGYTQGFQCPGSRKQACPFPALPTSSSLLSLGHSSESSGIASQIPAPL